MKDFLLSNGFSNDVWMKKSWSDEKIGYQFTLSINPKSGWSVLSQNGEGFTPYQISKMDNVDPDMNFSMSYNEIALLPFQSIEDVKQFWLLLTHTELF